MIDLSLALVAAASVATPFCIVVATRNRLVALDQRCETAYADIDAHLKHQQNLIPGLVETVRGFTKHEHEVLLGVTQAQGCSTLFTGLCRRG